MPSDSGDRLSSKPQNSGNPPSDHDSLPCPRCDSINTKFCYYNNYNLSQPRHFCKSCRRYWTQGGTLRNIPVGGGTRKNAKRSRTSPSSTTTTTSSCSSVSYPHHHQNQETIHHCSEYYNNGILVKPISFSSTDSISVKSDMSLAPLRCDINLNNVNINVSAGGGGGGGFTSLLNTNTQVALQGGNCGGGGPSPSQQQPPPPPQTGSGFLALGGFGLGLGSGFEDIGFEYGTKGFWAPLESVAAGSGATWLVGSGGGGHVGGGAGDVVDGGFVDGDHPYFAWPDLAISTTRKGLK